MSNIWILPYIFEFRRHIFEFRKRRLLIYRPRLRQESCWERHSPFDLTRSHREQLCVAWVATDSWKQPHFSPTFLRNLIFPSTTEILEKIDFFQHNTPINRGPLYMTTRVHTWLACGLGAWAMGIRLGTKCSFRQAWVATYPKRNKVRNCTMKFHMWVNLFLYKDSA